MDITGALVSYQAYLRALWHARHYQLFARRDLTIAQTQLLLAVAYHSSTTVTALAKYFELSLPRVSKTVNFLLSKGYLQRMEATHDRRTHLLTLTSQGEEFVAQLWDDQLRDMQPLLERMTSSDLDQIALAWTRLAELSRPEFCPSLPIYYSILLR